MKQFSRRPLEMSRPAERGKANAAGSEAEPRPVTASRRFEAQLHCQPVVQVWLHSPGDASPLHPNAAAALGAPALHPNAVAALGAPALHPNAVAALGAPARAALLLHQIQPVFSVVAPCPRGASSGSQRQTCTTGWQ